RAQQSSSQTATGLPHRRAQRSSRGTRSGVPRPAAFAPRRRAGRRRRESDRRLLPVHIARRGTRASADRRTARSVEIVRKTAVLSGSAAARRRQTRSELASRANAELPVGACEVRLDRAHAHEQLGGDLSVAPSGCGELRNALLGLRQFVRGTGTEADACTLYARAVREELNARSLEHLDRA